MAIRRVHTSVTDMANLGREVGAAQAAAAKEQQQLEMAKFTAQANQNERLALLGMEHDYDMKAFAATVQFEKQKQDHVWELERIDQTRQATLERDLMQAQIRSDVKFQDDLQYVQRQTADRNRKILSVQAAVKGGFISEDVGIERILKIQTGDFFPGTGRPKSTLEQMMAGGGADLFGEETVDERSTAKSSVQTVTVGADDIPDAPRRGGIQEFLNVMGGQGHPGQPGSDTQQVAKVSRLQKRLDSSSKPFIKTGIFGLGKKVPNMPVIKRQLQEMFNNQELNEEQLQIMQAAIAAGDDESFAQLYTFIKEDK